MRRWVSGKLVVLGDAAHAMVPYMSQGKNYQEEPLSIKLPLKHSHSSAS